MQNQNAEFDDGLEINQNFGNNNFRQEQDNAERHQMGAINI